MITSSDTFANLHFDCAFVKSFTRLLVIFFRYPPYSQGEHLPTALAAVTLVREILLAFLLLVVEDVFVVVVLIFAVISVVLRWRTYSRRLRSRG